MDFKSIDYLSDDDILNYFDEIVTDLKLATGAYLEQNIVCNDRYISMQKGRQAEGTFCGQNTFLTAGTCYYALQGVCLTRHGDYGYACTFYCRNTP